MAEHSSLWSRAAEWLEPAVQPVVERARTLHFEVLQGLDQRLAVLGIDLGDPLTVLAITAAVAIAVVLPWGLSRRLRRADDGPESLSDLTRSPRRLGLAAVLIFVGVFAGWSALAPLASAALAPGVVSPDGSRKAIQHLEGGIIRTIHVREGDRIAAGSPLVTLDDTRARALHAEIRERMLHLLATEARLEAERRGEGDLSIPEAVDGLDFSGLGSVIEGQRQLLLSRQATHDGRAQILAAKVRQLEEQNAGLAEIIAAQDRQIALIDEEIADSEQLLDRGLERKSRVLALKRGRADIEAEQAGHRARIAENGQAMGETRLQLLTLNEERDERINGELTEVRRLLAELRGQLPSREDILARTVIRAPIDGTVMNIRATTETGVVQPGQVLLELVPDEATLIIDARVQPTDIERVHPEMRARVLLTAYRQRNLPLIHGTLRSISADALADERTGERYFLAKVEVLAEDLDKLDGIELMPGMPAEVMLLDGEHSVVDYLLSPILDSARRSFREG